MPGAECFINKRSLFSCQFCRVKSLMPLSPRRALVAWAWVGVGGDATGSWRRTKEAKLLYNNLLLFVVLGLSPGPQPPQPLLARYYKNWTVPQAAPGTWPSSWASSISKPPCQDSSSQDSEGYPTSSHSIWLSMLLKPRIDFVLLFYVATRKLKSCDCLHMGSSTGEEFQGDKNFMWPQEAGCHRPPPSCLSHTETGPPAASREGDMSPFGRGCVIFARGAICVLLFLDGAVRI